MVLTVYGWIMWAIGVITGIQIMRLRRAWREVKELEKRD